MSNHTHVQLTNTGLEITAVVAWDGTDLGVDRSFFSAFRRYKVVGIIGRVDVAGAGGACTAIIRKVPSGTALASGTALHSSTFNLVGTATNTQTLTLSVTATDLEIAVGDSLVFDITGTPTSAVGSITVVLIPN